MQNATVLPKVTKTIDKISINDTIKIKLNAGVV